jgi:molybdopterin/thiamine biosynthesis adenylyltransferase
VTDRYSRQVLLPWLGESGQAKLAASSAAVVGVGALGCISSSFLARAGVGRLILVDRDFVEESNLHRQVLYTEQDAAQRLPKAVAAAAHLRDARSDLSVEALDADLDSELARRLARDCGVVVDGTDNFETRYLMNDAAVEAGKPWVYAGAVAACGSVFAVRPGVTACLRCLFPQAPAPGSAPTCETAGVLGPAVGAVASLQAGEAVKILAGREDLCVPGLLTVDLVDWSFPKVEVPRQPACPCCEARRFDFLEERAVSRTHVLCGRNGVMVLAPKGTKLDLRSLKGRLESIAPVFANPYLLQTEWEGHPVTLYADGRAMIQKTGDPARARALVARYLGM